MSSLPRLSVPPETARRMVEYGASILCLDVPAGMEVGIDYTAFTVGPRFMGFKMVPPGVHFLYYSAAGGDDSGPSGASGEASMDSDDREEDESGAHMSSEGTRIGIRAEMPRLGSRIGFFVRCMPREVLVLRWSPRAEDFDGPAVLGDDFVEPYIAATRRMEFDQGLGPYPFSTLSRWSRLSRFISPDVLDRLEPEEGRLLSTNARRAQLAREAVLTDAKRSGRRSQQEGAGSGAASGDDAEPARPVGAGGAEQEEVRGAEAQEDSGRSGAQALELPAPEAPLALSGGAAALLPERSGRPDSAWDERRAAARARLWEEAASEVPLAAAQRLKFRQVRGVGPECDPQDRTMYAMDTSPAVRDLMQQWDDLPMGLLGEVQLAFIAFYLGHVMEGFEQWKRLVDCLCRCEAALLEAEPDQGTAQGPDADRSVVDEEAEFDIGRLSETSESYRALSAEWFEVAFAVIGRHLQEVPTDFFVDEFTRSNFLQTSLSQLARIVRSEGAMMAPPVWRGSRGLLRLCRRRFGWAVDRGIPAQQPQQLSQRSAAALQDRVGDALDPAAVSHEDLTQLWDRLKQEGAMDDDDDAPVVVALGHEEGSEGERTRRED